MGFNVVGIGEVLWDLLPDGPQLGGAPANFAYHAQALGANAAVISRVGNDPLGAEVRRRFHEMGLPLAGLQVDTSSPTGTVSVSLGGAGIPSYVIHERVAWDQIEASSAALELVRRADVVCFGSLAQRSESSRGTIQRLVDAAPPHAWRVLDVNLRQSFFSRVVIERSLELASVLKLNDHELPQLAQMFGFAGSDRSQIEQLAQRFDLEVVALTRGAAGSLLYRDGQWAEGPAETVSVQDTVGAGDAFTAALCVGLLQNLELEEISRVANRIAAFVCGSRGATPALPDSFRRLAPPRIPLPSRA